MITSVISVISCACFTFIMRFLLAGIYGKTQNKDDNRPKLNSLKKSRKEAQESSEFKKCSEYSQSNSELVANLYFQRKKNSKSVYFTFIPKVKSTVPS